MEKLKQWSAIFIAGIFTIIGGSVSHYGIPLIENMFRNPNIYEFDGIAKELNYPISQFPGFSTRTSLLSFNLPNIKMEIIDDYARLHGTIKTFHKDGTESFGNINGKGNIIDGVIYYSYKVIENSRNGGTWNGVGVLKMSKKGTWFGYWLTDDIYQETKGKFIGGTIEFTPK